MRHRSSTLPERITLRTTLSPRRPLALLTAGLMSAALIAGSATAATAASTPSTVSETALPTAQLNGVAFDQVVVGDTVYVAGLFSRATPIGGASVPRANLLAYNLRTGQLLAWNPGTNGLVRALAASEDGSRIYLTGAFTKVGGRSRTRIAAVSAATGAVDSRFHPGVNASGYALAVRGSTVYAGGAFTSASGKARQRTAAFDWKSGALRSWSPKVNDTVLALVVSKAGGSVVLAGRFSKVNGQNQAGTQRVTTGSGRKNVTWAFNSIAGNNGKDAAIYSLSTNGSMIVGTGYSYHPTTKQKRLEGSFTVDWNGKLNWLEDCHGDSYSASIDGDVVYLAGHPHSCTTVPGGADFVPTDPPTYHRALAFTTARGGTLAKWTHGTYSTFPGLPAPELLAWRPAFNTGEATGQDQGPWDVTNAKGYVLYAGEFTKVNGKPQQGLVRFQKQG